MCSRVGDSRTAFLLNLVCLCGQVYSTSYNINYIAINETKNWADAEAYCESTFGTTLATITSSSENSQVRETANQLFGNEKIWIGLNDRTIEGTFEWIDDTSNNWTNWNSNEPNDETITDKEEDCVEIWASGGWNDLTCSYDRRFVCNLHAFYGNGYIFVSSNLSWHNGQSFCNSAFNTSLATITSAEENEIFRQIGNQFIGKEKIMIGLNDIDINGNFEWIDGTGNAVDYYTNWDDNVSVNGSEHCVEMLANGDWNVISCDREYGSFACNYGSYIGVNDNTSNWHQAQEYCEKNYSMSLATIRNRDQVALALRAAADSFWHKTEGHVPYKDRFFIGLYYDNETKSWQWIDGSTSKYRYNFDVSGDGYCAEQMVHSNSKVQQWNDLLCTSKRYFVCENQTSFPTYVPTQFPTTNPTNTPTMATLYPTLYPTNVESDENTNGEQTIVIIMICISVLLCVGMIFLFIICHKKKESKKQSKTEIELKQRMEQIKNREKNNTIDPTTAGYNDQGSHGQTRNQETISFEHVATDSNKNRGHGHLSLASRRSEGNEGHVRDNNDSNTTDDENSATYEEMYNNPQTGQILYTESGSNEINTNHTISQTNTMD